MGNRESQLLSRSPSAGPAGASVAAATAAALSVSGGSSGSGSGPSLGGSLSLPSFTRRSLASSLSSLGLSLAAFGAPLAELESPLRSPASPSPSSPMSSAAAAALTRPRIHPILRGGRQLSEDLHWVLPPRTKRRPPPSPKRRPDETAEVATADASAPYGPGRTPLDLVRGVTEQVFGVTDEESCVALSLHKWDPEAAARYLKVEQLFRLGIADRDACRELLGAHGWRLETACAAAFLS